jgi:hypothetical protein
MGSARFDITEDGISFRKPKQRNHLVKELFDGNYSPKREEPKNAYKRKEKYNTWKNNIVEDDEDD